MPLSLTEQQFYARLHDPCRQRLLELAFNEDVKQLFPLKKEIRQQILPGNAEIQVDTDLTEVAGQLFTKMLDHVLALVYDENLD